MKKILSWANTNPILTAALSLLLFGLIPFSISNSELKDDPPVWALAAIAIFALGGWLCFALWKNSKNIITLLLIAGLVAAPVKQARSAMLGVGVVVICVGGYCVYKVVSICQKKFPPKSTNTPPEEFSATSQDEYGGSMEYSSIGSCLQMPDFSAAADADTHNPTTFTLSVIVEPAGATVSMSADNTEGTTQTWDQFQAEMAGRGLFLTGRPSYQPQFESGGSPCDPSIVPLEFDPATGRVTQRTGGEMRRVSIERSSNLTDWYPLLVTDVGVGTGFKLVDTTRTDQMFYRVAVQETR